MKIKEKDFWSEKIPFIKKLKKFYSKIKYDGVEVWPIMANEVYTYYKNQDRDFKDRLKLILRFLFLRENLKVQKSKGKILASYFMARDDHHELVKRTISRFGNKEIYFMDGYEYKKNPLKMYKPTLPNFALLFSVWLKFEKNNLKEVLGKYYWLFIARTYQRCTQIKYFKKIINDLEPKAYFAFCSPAFGEEAIMTLICKQKGIPTLTMQHGFFRDAEMSFGPEILFNENAIADYFLLWGEKTADIQKNYIDESRIIVAGNPKYDQLEERIRKEFKPKKGTIFFGNSSFNDGNIELLKIIKKFIENHPEITFNVTVHPMNDANIFLSELKFDNVKFAEGIQVQELLENSDFVVLYSTSVAMEALNYSIPIFEYEGKDFLKFWDRNVDSFKDLKDLEAIFSKLKNKKEHAKLLDFYKKELNKIFYFEKNKSVPEVYYEKINEVIKNHENLFKRRKIT